MLYHPIWQLLDRTIFDKRRKPNSKISDRYIHPSHRPIGNLFEHQNSSAGQAAHPTTKRQSVG